MTFEKKINWGDVILAALLEINNTDEDVSIAVPDKHTAKIIQALAALQEAGDIDVWRINVEVRTKH
jgi:hypothetical protein